MIPFILAAIGGYLIGDSVGEEIDSKIPKFEEGGDVETLEKQLDYMRVAPTTFEEDMKETAKYFGDNWNTLTEEQKIKLKDELKGIGIVGHSGQKEDLDTYMYSLFYKKGGKTNG